MYEQHIWTDELLSCIKIIPKCEHCDAPYDVDETGYCYLCRPGFVKDRERDLETIKGANEVIRSAIERIKYTLKYINHKPIEAKISLTLSEAMELGMVTGDDLKQFALEYLKHNKI